MASCAKCGKHPIKKDKTGMYACKRCGVRPTFLKFERSGINHSNTSKADFDFEMSGKSILETCTGPHSISTYMAGNHLEKSA